MAGSWVGGGDTRGDGDLGAGGGGMLVGESRGAGGGGGEEGDARSLGEVTGVTALRSSVDSMEAGGEVGGGGVASCSWGGLVGSSAIGDDVGRGRAGESGGATVGRGEEGDAARGGVASSGGGRVDDSSLKQTHLSAASSAALSCSGPKMLSRSAIDGFRVETFASVDASEEPSHKVRGDELNDDTLHFFPPVLESYLHCLERTVHSKGHS